MWFLWPCALNLIKSNRNHPSKHIQILMVAHTHTHSLTHTSPTTKMQWNSQSRLVNNLQNTLAHPQTLNPPTFTQITCRHIHIIYFTQWDTCLAVASGQIERVYVWACALVFVSGYVYNACSVQIQVLTSLLRWIRINWQKQYGLYNNVLPIGTNGPMGNSYTAHMQTHFGIIRWNDKLDSLLRFCWCELCASGE